MMEERYKQINEKIHPRPALLQEMRNKQAAKKGRVRVWTRVTAALLCLCLVAGGAFALGNWGGRKVSPYVAAPTALPATDGDVSYAAEADEGGFIHPASYEELYDSLMQRGNYGGRDYGITGGLLDAMETDAPVADEAAPAPGASVDRASGDFKAAESDMAVSTDMEIADTTEQSESGTGAGDPDYSETNVQVLGIDEADIVKTDGNYIYVLSQESRKLFIVQADGENSKVIGSLQLVVNGSREEQDSAWPTEIYLAEDKVFILFSSHTIQPLYSLDDTASARAESTDKIYPGGGDVYSPKTILVCVDVSDRANPKQTAQLAQDGSYADSRMANGYIYIISTQYPLYYGRIVTPDAIEAYCPGVEVDGEYRILPIEDIVICPEAQSVNYTLISSVSVANGKDFADTIALSGSGGNVYFDGQNLLLAENSWTSKNGAESRDSNGRLYIDTFNGSLVQLALFTVDGGKITEVATGSIEGNLLNQFSMDIAHDSFRFVVNRNSSTQRIYTEGVDEYGEWSNKQDNCLYILDKTLNLIGKVEGLGEDEQVKSVRFMGDIAYFVTFRQTDPLFAVDLADPRNPKVLSKLKVPGFSSYLHPYGEGLLFGFGSDADEDGRVGNLKLSMYDIANNADVRELHTEVLKKATWSSATWNHKAIFVNAQKNRIAFPAEGKYYVYAYDAKTGFVELGVIQLSSDGAWLDDARGLYINDCFYVVTATRVFVLSLESMEELAVVKL